MEISVGKKMSPSLTYSRRNPSTRTKLRRLRELRRPKANLSVYTFSKSRLGDPVEELLFSMDSGRVAVAGIRLFQNNRG